MSKFQKGDTVLYAKQDKDDTNVPTLVGKRGKITTVCDDGTGTYHVEIVKDAALSITALRILSEDSLEYVDVFKVGDFVELIDKDRHPNEGENFTLQEGLQLETGYPVIYVSDPDNSGFRWIRIFKDGVLHHPEKFKRWVPEPALPFKKFDLVKINKPGSERDGQVVSVQKLPNDNDFKDRVLVKDQSGRFFNYSPEVLSLAWEYQEFAIGDKVVIISYTHPVHGGHNHDLKKDGLSMHNIYTVKDVTALGTILLDIGLSYHDPEFFKMFDRKDKTKVVSGIVQIKRDLERKGHQWISLLNV